MSVEKIDNVTGTATTGHEWDGIRELNTPLPRWWLWLFYICIVWGIGYLFLYPAIPLASSYTRGLLGYASRDTIETDMAALKMQRGAVVGQIETASLADIEKSPQMLTVARALGKAAFGTNCGPCHGQGGQGAATYPNLNDDQWIWGGTLDQIHQTIQHGIRNDTLIIFTSDHGEKTLSTPLLWGKSSLYDLGMYHSAQYYFIEVLKKGPSNPYFKYALPKLVAISTWRRVGCHASSCAWRALL